MTHVYPACAQAWNFKQAYMLAMISGLAVQPLHLPFQSILNIVSQSHTLIDNQRPMNYQIDKQEHYTVLTLHEEILSSTIAPQLKRDMILLSQQGVRNFILDLSNVKYVDSSGLSAILAGNRIWKDIGGSFVLAGELQDAVNKLINLATLEHILMLIPTVSESINYIMNEEVARQLENE